MSHEISSASGTYAFADSRAKNGKTDAWHALGTPVGHAMTAQEALEAAHLANWNVRKRPIWVDIREDSSTQAGLIVPRQYATVFDNPITKKIEPIGVVGERYTPVENEAMAGFGNAIVDEYGPIFETAGSLRNFSQVFLTMKLPQTMVLEGLDGSRDVTEWYLALFNSHDGSSALFGIITGVRVVCANTAGVAIRGAKSKFSIRHTSGAMGAVAAARSSLGLAFEYEAAFEEEARALFEQPFSESDMLQFAKDLSEVDKVEEDGPAFARRTNAANSIVKLFVESPTIKGTPVAGTKWGAYNAVTEYVDHYQGVRATSPVEEDVLRANRSILQAVTADSAKGLKADAWKILTTA